MSLNLIKIKILSFQIRKFPRLCIHISRSRARSWPRRQKGSVEEGGGGRFGGADFRCYRGGTVAPLHGQTTVRFPSEGEGQHRPARSIISPVLMEATVESAPAYTLRNYSNAGVVTLRLFVSHRFIDDSKNASF